LVKIVKKKKNPNPIPIDVLVTFRIIDELKEVCDKEAPVYEFLGREIRLSKLSRYAMNLLKKWIREHPDRVGKILDRIEFHLAMRRELKKKVKR